jgi:hypothetical protein
MHPSVNACSAVRRHTRCIGSRESGLIQLRIRQIGISQIALIKYEMAKIHVAQVEPCQVSAGEIYRLIAVAEQTQATNRGDQRR